VKDADFRPDDIESLRLQLAEEHKMASLGRLLAGIVHEINTPVGSILSNNQVVLRSLEMLKNDLDQLSGERASHALALVATCQSLAQVDKIACERIGAVVRGLKSFARADSGELQRVDLAEQIAGTLKLLQGEYGRRVTFENQAPPDLPRLECYPGKLNQALLNIIANGAQAIEGNGKVTIAACARPGSIEILIRDTGKGIPQSVREKIFQSGYTSKPAGHGTGLGLTISRQIVVDLHQGTLDFQSEPGVGTTFIIQLPLTQKSL
jgi:signal transduction histidine kinase